MRLFRVTPRRLGLAVGWVFIVGLWAALLGFTGLGIVDYDVYLDLKYPFRHHWIDGTGAETMARNIYQRRYRHIWQGMSECAEFDPELIYRPRAGVARFTGAEFDTTIHITPQHVRAQPAPADPRAPLIVVAGDSFTLGWGVQDDETYSYLLQRDFGYHTVNTGVPSYGTARELLRLRRMGLLRHIDALIIQFCDNDQPENVGYLRDFKTFGDPRDFRVILEELRRTNPLELSYFGIVRDVSHYLRIRTRAVGPRRTLRELLRTPPPFGKLLGERFGLGEDMAAGFLAVLDLFPELKDTPILVTEMVSNNGYTGFTDNLRRLAKDRTNVIPIVIHYEPADFLRLDTHLSAQGHRTAASQLAAALKRVLGGRTKSDAAAQHPGY